jgi:ribose-phosphate pyrophosphokinase
MQGFFARPVDNLYAEPLIARWIRMNVPRWNEAVVVTKNAGGSKRFTSLADALKLNFGIVTTDRRRHTMSDSAIFFDSVEHGLPDSTCDAQPPMDQSYRNLLHRSRPPPKTPPLRNAEARPVSSSLANVTHPGSPSPPAQVRDPPPEMPPSARRQSEEDAVYECTDERAQQVITGRLVQGHIVDDDYPSPGLSSLSASVATLPADGNNTDSTDASAQDPMTMSFVSTVSSYQAEHALGGSQDAEPSSDEDEKLQSPGEERTITLVGDVNDKTVFLLDDMIDKCGSWIAAAETVVKKGGAKKVYCIATHGLFGYDSLETMEACECIDYIVITNSFPISPLKAKNSRKLVIIDLSALLSESIRRNHYGERSVPPSVASD